MAKVKCAECSKEVEKIGCKPVNLDYKDNPGANGQIGTLTYNYICKDCQNNKEERNGAESIGQ